MDGHGGERVKWEGRGVRVGWWGWGRQGGEGRDEEGSDGKGRDEKEVGAERAGKGRGGARLDRAVGDVLGHGGAVELDAVRVEPAGVSRSVNSRCAQEVVSRRCEQRRREERLESRAGPVARRVEVDAVGGAVEVRLARHVLGVRLGEVALDLA